MSIKIYPCIFTLFSEVWDKDALKLLLNYCLWFFNEGKLKSFYSLKQRKPLFTMLHLKEKYNLRHRRQQRHICFRTLVNIT